MRIHKEYNEAGALDYMQKSMEEGLAEAVWIEKGERPSPNGPQTFRRYPGLIMVADATSCKL